MDLLILLVESRRQLVSRSDIVDRLWGKDVFVDVETGVNTAISKVRQALRDSPDAPAFVETVPGKGYRFIAAVEVVPVRRMPAGQPRNRATGARCPSRADGVTTADLPRDHEFARSSTAPASPDATDRLAIRTANPRVLRLAWWSSRW